MKFNKSLWVAIGLLIIVGSVSRLFGFAPQIAMAIFGGAMIKDKKLAFVVPMISMLLSDVLMEVLFVNGYFPYSGFYSGQVTNYVLLASLTLFGFMVKSWNVARIATAAVAAPTTYFLISNFIVWANGGGYSRPKNFGGLMMCYTDALPFYRSYLISTLVFSVIFFGGYYLVQRFVLNRNTQIA
ncbi:DUF6580 family putative transport protein [Flavisolibacter tropicus]|uniref:Uncharacterized protein n=1 Tax=Flavisolibacter tropicus TaxID=1492898 RepID=A0A172U0N6_9BACT|nr:DUF6580 family putative transport protein [Flavisolibacter tropicus]ANE52915.1 hypothetical protein SY85_22980 [Flavisolibacter tropicus]